MKTKKSDKRLPFTRGWFVFIVKKKGILFLFDVTYKRSE